MWLEFKIQIIMWALTGNPIVKRLLVRLRRKNNYGISDIDEIILQQIRGRDVTKGFSHPNPLYTEEKEEGSKFYEQIRGQFIDGS
jgi:hypothetical protein